jgi:hypothetical protein
MPTTTASLAYSAPVNFYISQSPPPGLPPETQPAFDELYQGVQNIIQALVNNCGIGPQSIANWAQLAGSPSTLLAGNLNRLYVLAVETIPFGAMISLTNSAGVLVVRNAQASTAAKMADGFCTTGAGIAIGSVGEVQLADGVTNFTGLVVGSRYWLDAVNPGLVTPIAPVAVGNIEQYIGRAITTTSLAVHIGYPIQH